MKKIISTGIAMLAIVITCKAQWTTSSNDIYNSNTGNVGIGTTSPRRQLSVGSYLDIYSGSVATTTTPSIRASSAGNLILNSFTGTGNIYLNSDHGSGMVYVGTSSGSTRIAINGAANGNSYFNSGGYVGIGNTAPKSLLQIGAPASSLPSTNVAESQVITTGNRVGDTAGSILYSSEYDINGSANVNRFQTILYRRVAGTAWQGNEYRLQYAVDNSFTDGSKAFISVGGSDPNASGGGFISLATGGTDRLAVNSAGNIGIGTTSPSSRLDVESSANSSWATQIVNNGTTNAHGLYVNIGSGSTGTPFRVDVNGTDMFQVSNNGNVAIGTTDPQGHKLAVNGDIIATKVKVLPFANWPDYVFKPQYHLPSLSQVKSYINQNQHLPDLPSEKEVAKDGVDLGEMVKLQTKKIEELTLYLIEKDKQMNTQNDKLINQQNEINQLKQSLKVLIEEIRKN